MLPSPLTYFQSYYLYLFVHQSLLSWITQDLAVSQSHQQTSDTVGTMIKYYDIFLINSQSNKSDFWVHVVVYRAQNSKKNWPATLFGF